MSGYLGINIGNTFILAWLLRKLSYFLCKIASMRLGNRIICELCQEKKKQKKKYYIQIKHAEKKDC